MEEEVPEEKFVRPIPVDYGVGDLLNAPKYDKETCEIMVVCVKYGTKYGADYVNKRHAGVKRHLSLDHQFACFTENTEGLNEDIKVIPLKSKNEDWSGWWSKVNINFT